MTAIKQMKLTLLENTIEGCRLCFKKKPKRVVFGSGNMNAEMAIIGEAPSVRCKGEGTPFGEKGKSRPVFEALLKELGVMEDEIWVTNVVKCAIPDVAVGSRNKCQQFLLRELDIIKPEIVICLGRTAVDSLTTNRRPLTGEKWKATITITRTNWFAIESVYGLPHPMVVVYGNMPLEGYLKLVSGVKTSIQRESS